MGHFSIQSQSRCSFVEHERFYQAPFLLSGLFPLDIIPRGKKFTLRQKSQKYSNSKNYWPGFQIQLFLLVFPSQNFAPSVQAELFEHLVEMDFTFLPEMHSEL